MPAIDQCEPQVIRAFQNAGWVVTNQPFYIKVAKNETVYADLRLEHNNHSRGIIVVEVKCFAQQRSIQDEFYHALGQYFVYRSALTLRTIDLPLYLSVPQEVFNTFFQRSIIQTAVRDAKIKVVVIDLESESIVSWID